MDQQQNRLPGGPIRDDRRHARIPHGRWHKVPWRLLAEFSSSGCLPECRLRIWAMLSPPIDQVLFGYLVHATPPREVSGSMKSLQACEPAPWSVDPAISCELIRGCMQASDWYKNLNTPLAYLVGLPGGGGGWGGRNQRIACRFLVYKFLYRLSAPAIHAFQRRSGW
jgi:hypothetical protein